MKLPTVSLLCSALFMIYILNSIVGLIRLFTPPQCKPGETCIPYYLNQKQKLQLVAFTTVKEWPTSSDEIFFVGKISDLQYTAPFEKTLNLILPAETRRNGTLYLHLFVLPQGRRVKTWSEALTAPDYVFTQILLTYYQVPTSSTYQLLKGDKSNEKSLPVSHLKTEVGIKMLTELESFPKDQVPPELYRFFKLSKNGAILPLLHYDFLHDRISHLEEIGGNRTAQVVLKYSPVNIGKFRLMLHTEMSLTSLKKYGFSDKDLDQVKGIFADTNIYLLCVTIFVSSVHLLFDFLALKNDVNFWRTRSTLAGLSLRTVLWRAFSQVIILLYLFDEETSLLVLGPAGVATLIELWKVQKVIPIDWRRLKLKTVVLTDDEQKTRIIDAEGMQYLAYVLYPLCGCSAVYSLIYQNHKSWYSWIIHSLVNAVYAFGFLFMLPQLFINYKMKSVAHLPWRAFMYKAFNTFIDDLFAFIIAMPTAHRLACFRDDIVFLIYLYQRWLYPVDKTRTDETVVMATSEEKKND